MTTLAELEAAFDRCRKEEYQIFVSFYGSKTSVSLSKRNRNGTQVETRGEAETVEEAFRQCLTNFPKNPLDGSTWVSKQLAKPEPTEDAIYIDIKDTL